MYLEKALKKIVNKLVSFFLLYMRHLIYVLFPKDRNNVFILMAPIFKHAQQQRQLYNCWLISGFHAPYQMGLS